MSDLHDVATNHACTEEGKLHDNIKRACSYGGRKVQTSYAGGFHFYGMCSIDEKCPEHCGVRVVEGDHNAKGSFHMVI